MLAKQLKQWNSGEIPQALKSIVYDVSVSFVPESKMVY